jgi:O-antigen ligase
MPLITERISAVKILIVILFSIMIGFLTSLEYLTIALGFVFFVCICLFLKSMENIFLFWLLLFSFFATEPVYFLKISGREVFTFDRTIIFLIFVFILLQAFMRRRKLLPINKIDIVMLLFFLIICNSMQYNKLAFYGLKGVVDGILIPFIIFFLSKILIRERKQLNRFVTVLIIIGLFLSLLGIFEAITLKDVFPTDAGLPEHGGFLRVNGPYNSDVGFGINVSICFLFLLYKYTILSFENKDQKKLIGKWLLILLGLLFILGLFFNYYRGIWLACLLGVMFWMISQRNQRKWFFLCLFVFSLVYLSSFNVLKTSYFFKQRLANIDSIESRFNIYQALVTEIKRSPLTGVGIFNHQNKNELLRGGGHNNFLAILADLGIVGFLFYVLLFGVILSTIISKYKFTKVFLFKEYYLMSLSVIIIYLTSGMGLLIWYTPEINKLFFAIIGTAIGLVEENESKI